MRKNKSNVMGYSTIEGVIRQTMKKEMKTTELTFEVPLDGSDNYRMNECVEQIAQLIDQYFGTQIEDVTRINDLVDQEIVASWRRERDNQVEINGGSK